MSKDTSLSRGELGIRMLCAWNNIPRDKAPASWSEHHNEWTREAWARVADAATASQKAEIERLKDAMEKIDAIRNSIIGYQTVGWSAHIYPLVAALEDAGFRGEGYEKSRELAKTQVDAILALTEENDRLRFALSEALNGKE